MTGKIPQRFIDDVLARVDLVELIDARVPLTRMGKEYKARCPFHEERTPSFTVSPEKQFFHCFGCGAHGTAIGFLMDYDHHSFLEAVEELAARVGLSIPSEQSGSRVPVASHTELFGILQQADKFYRLQLRRHPDTDTAIAYLKKRGVTGRVAADFGLGFAPDGWDNLLRALGTSEAQRTRMARAGLLVHKDGGGYYDRFRHRIMFPIHDHRGRVAGFGGRILGDGEPKYLNSPETPVYHKGAELYGLYRARGAIKDADRCLVVEGYMDVLALTQAGIGTAVATLGTATTRVHLERIFRLASAVVFCFDGDRAGQAAAWRALETVLPQLNDGHQVSFLFLPEGEDPDSLVRKDGAETFSARIDKAEPLPDYLFRALQDQTDLSRLDGRARLVELARPYLSRIPVGALRQMMVERLAALSRSDAAALVDGASPPGRARGARRATPASPATAAALPVQAQAIALLLQNPLLAAELDVQPLAGLDLPGISLLFELVAQLRENPRLSTAALLERFRGSVHHERLEKLAIREHLVSEHNMVEVFQETITGLEAKFLEQKIGALLARSRAEGLGPDGEQELAGLLRRRHSAGKTTGDEVS